MNKTAFFISILYFFAGILWFSFLNGYFVPAILLHPPFDLAILTRVFGLSFVILTSLIIYFLVARNAVKTKFNQKLYEKLFEDSPSPMWIYDISNFQFLAVNKTAIHKYGHSKGDFLNLTLEDIRPPETIGDLYTSINNRKNHQYNEDGPFLHRKKNGETFFVQINSRPTIFQGKEARLVVAVDIDEKIKAEQRSKEAYKELSDYRLAISSTTVVFATDLQGNVNWANENFCQLSGYTKQELLSFNLRYLSSGLQEPTLFDDMFGLLITGQNWQGEIQQRNKAGDNFWLHINIVPIRNKSGYIGRYIAICTDITEKKQVQEKLVQREKLLSSVVNSQNNFLIRFDQRNQLTYANAMFLEHFGIEAQSLATVNFSTILCEEDSAVFEKIKTDCCKNPGKILSTELRQKTAEEKLIWTSWEFICISARDENDCEIQGMGHNISQGKMAEKELQRSTKRLDKILDSINVAFYTIDRSWCFIKINKKFEEVFGKSRAQVMGKNVWEVFPQAVETPFFDFLHKAMSEDIPLTFEEEGTKPGTWFQVSIYPVTEGISGYATDITSKKEAERELQQAVKRYDSLTKSTFDTIWDVDLQTNTIEWNEGIHTHFKYPKETIPHSLDIWEKKVHPDDYSRVVNSLYTTISDKRTQWEEEYRLLCGDGAYRYVSDRGHVLYDEKQQPVRMIGAIQDIHKQKEYQKEIKKLSLVAEKTQNAVVITDKYGRIEWVNEGFTRLTGWLPEEAFSRTHDKFLYGPATDEYIIDSIQYKLAKKEKFSEELIYYNKKGIPFWVRMDVSPIFDEKGELVQYISIETDITERKRFENMLQKQNEQLKEIAWISSHDIRRPVASILGLINLYDANDPSKPFNQDIINLLNVSTKELDKVIRKIVYKTYEVEEMKNEGELKFERKTFRKEIED